MPWRTRIVDTGPPVVVFSLIVGIEVAVFGIGSKLRAKNTKNIYQKISYFELGEQQYDLNQDQVAYDSQFLEEAPLLKA